MTHSCWQSLHWWQLWGWASPLQLSAAVRGGGRNSLLFALPPAAHLGLAPPTHAESAGGGGRESDGGGCPLRPGLAPAGDQGCSREERILRKPLLDGDPSSLWSAPHVDCLLRVWGEREGEARQEGSCRWDPTGPAHRCTRGLCRPHRCVSGLLPPAHDGHPPSFLHFITESFTCTIRTLQCAPASSGVSCSLRHPLGFGCELVIMEHPVLAVLLSGGVLHGWNQDPQEGSHSPHCHQISPSNPPAWLPCVWLSGFRRGDRVRGCVPRGQRHCWHKAAML